MASGRTAEGEGDVLLADALTRVIANGLRLQ